MSHTRFENLRIYTWYTIERLYTSHRRAMYVLTHAFVRAHARFQDVFIQVHYHHLYIRLAEKSFFIQPYHHRAM